jgi:hypothetical protein
MKKRQQRSPEEAEFLAPDGTWGLIVVVICTAILALLVLIPTRAGGSPSSKFYLAGFALLWMASGIRRVAAARMETKAWTAKDLTKR